MAIIGVIADDFTGASDIASFLVKGGLATNMITDFRKEAAAAYDLSPEKAADAVVIALKSRTQETSAAVADSLAALACLQACGCTHFYVKYCSTFDSTSEGNIGPICDALMDALGCSQALLCPALPVNGRTVSGGKLYVNGELLEDSPMRNHPLTPMTESDLVKLMDAQSRYKSEKIGKPAADWKREDFADTVAKGYLVPDCEDEEDLKLLAKVFGSDVLITGGSGLAPFLGQYLKPDMAASAALREEKAAGHALLIAGSCSKATREQIADYQSKGKASIKISAEEISAGTLDKEALFAQVLDTLEKEEILVYSSDDPAHTKAILEKDPTVPEKIEALLSSLAKAVVDKGFRRVIVAGGETSGAVTVALQIHSVRIGESIAPGVPAMTSLEDETLRIVLKSGNFGQKDFFDRAIRML